ncbi:MAG: DUF167 domain-containing protein [Candidatus Aenigmatarchaeota archaeon]|nr:MAG: DUF167 domain-containing protein [Candidatus Aenigmarchaeota archaeon]
MIIKVRVKPGSSQERVVLDGDTLIVWLHARPTEGKANAELLCVLKKTFGRASLVSGRTSKLKTVEIPQRNYEDVISLVSSVRRR